MNTHMSQKGSAHVIIIIVLICLLFAGLGFVFWQNFIKQKEPAKTAETSQSTEQTKQVEFVEAMLDPAFGTMVSFRYPATWKLDRTISGPMPIQQDNSETTRESVKLTSPSGKYTVRYEMNSHGGVGGACDENDTSNEVAQIEYDQLDDFKGVNFVQLITKDNRSSTYIYDIGLKQGQYFNDRIVGDPICQVAVALSGVLMAENGRMLLIDGGITSLNNENGVSRNIATLNGVRENFSGEEYEQMKAIMVSTKGKLEER